MYTGENDPATKEYQTYKANYDYGKGLITIDFSPEAIRFTMKNNVSYKMSLDRIMSRIDECFKKSASLLNNRQSTSEPLKEGG